MVPPYQRNSDLPPAVRRVLPEHAQEIYRKAFNNAWKQYARPEKRKAASTLEVTARRVAWSAVEKVYEKKAGQWVKI